MATYSIILPVRNGGHYIKDCISSILNQTLNDFDLLVLDNCSTDGTTEWLQSLSDQRIRLFPASSSLTIEQNWARIRTIPKNKFITLIGHDDVLDKNFLETIDRLIQESPAASLYQTHFRYIDAVGSTIRDCKPMKKIESPSEFLAHFLKGELDIMGTGYVMKAADYDMLGGIPPYPNLLFADFELWINLTKRAYKVTSSVSCYAFRVHQSMTTLSSDSRYLEAFSRFIGFLVQLKEESKQYDEVITENGRSMLMQYCQGMVHRLIRTPVSARNGIMVEDIIREFRRFSTELGVEKSFDPGQQPSISLARLIDSNRISRSLFRSFKRLFPKPILK